jgi:hypothetical protein
MADLPFTPPDASLAARLYACLDVEGKIPRALETLGPLAGRDVVLVDGDGGRRVDQLTGLGARIRIVVGSPAAGRLDADDGSADVVVGMWSAFRGPWPDQVADADRVLRPGGRLLIVHDYGRDDVSRLRGDLPEYDSWSRRNGWFLSNGFRIRVIHCFWTFESIDDARDLLESIFGEAGAAAGATLRRPRLTYNVAVYHRSRSGPEPAS